MLLSQKKVLSSKQQALINIRTSQKSGHHGAKIQTVKLMIRNTSSNWIWTSLQERVKVRKACISRTSMTI